MTICATITTKGRYFNTLNLCLHSLISQTLKPNRVIIYDDNNPSLDLRNIEIYQHLFARLDEEKISWEVVYTPHLGQVWSNSHALNTVKEDLIFRIDDDCVLEADVLEKLYNTLIEDNHVSAVGGIILDPKISIKKSTITSSKIEDIYLGMNTQWFRNTDPDIKSYEVDHLYSTFLFIREIALKCGGYNKDLSIVSFREDTMFTANMKFGGYKLLINPWAITWHYKSSEGGTRSYNSNENYLRDDVVFARYLTKHSIIPTEYRWIILNSGLGDHLAFKNSGVLEDMFVKYSRDNFIIAVCYPEVFNDLKISSRLKICSIAEAEFCLGTNIEKYNIYKWCVDNNWSESIIEAYRRLYANFN